MNFAALPPEINSGLMYAGPGSGPMLTAAAAWDGVAVELRSAGMVYQSVVSGLTSQSWLGPSSAAMAAAAAPYAGWLAATSTQAEQTATQVRAAAAAYAAAFASTVPPAVIAANRAQLAALVATNVFGQNTPAIAATEAGYGEMWAQDAAAMYGYSAAASAAAALTPFQPAPQTSNPAGPAAATAAQGLVTSAQLAQAVPLGSVIPVIALAVSSTSTAVSPSIAGSAWNAAATNNRILIGNTQGILANGEELHLMEREMLDLLYDLHEGSGLAATLSGFRAGAAGLPGSAVLGGAVSAGKLSVPLSWAAAAPEIRTVAYALPITSAAAAPAGAPGTAFSQMALAGMGGSALAGAVNRREQPAAAFPGEHPKPNPDEPEESTQEPPESPVAELVAGIRQLGELRDSGLLTVEEFAEQKQRLLYRPLR